MSCEDELGLTIVKFNDEATQDFVLETGIVQFDKKPVIVRPWTQDLDTIRLVRFVPLWIRLPNLGLQYWGQKCLSSLVSTIGKPIMVDKFTNERFMIKYARIYVEMEITDGPLFVIYFVNKRGEVQEQFVEYEWLPIKCKNCKGFGHNMVECKKNGPKSWVKKSVTEKEPAGTNVVPEIAPTDTISGDLTGDPVDIKEVEEKHDEAGIDVRRVAKEKGNSQDHPLTPDQDNKENWEIPKRVGNSKGRGKLVRTDIDKKQNAFKVLQEQGKGEKIWNLNDSKLDGLLQYT
ncbi:uncharacterized protein LOC133779263 [Humulus lupulus]|uniref:uncharacterized protein LOC133779263 n=1 Tax=Humulus lupulus TaxID=3486 RepID=UPI002B40108E|nr:uncharacterized protein LOC133779263 [Humulus lupulus]